MIEGDDDHKVLVFALDLKKLKLEGKSLKAQVASDFENVKGVFVKKYHYTNSAGQKAPLTYLIAIHNINGQLGKWPGPIIEANSMEEADEWCKKNTQYLFVEQEVLDVQKTTEPFSNAN